MGGTLAALPAHPGRWESLAQLVEGEACALAEVVLHQPLVRGDGKAERFADHLGRLERTGQRARHEPFDATLAP